MATPTPAEFHEVLDRALAAEQSAADRGAEVERLRTELARWESGQRRKFLPVVESVPDGITYAALLLHAQGTEGGEEHDELLREAADRLKRLSDAASYLLAEAQTVRARSEAEQAVIDAAPAVASVIRHNLAALFGTAQAAGERFVGAVDALDAVPGEPPVVPAALIGAAGPASPQGSDPDHAPGGAPDLMAALQASLKQARADRERPAVPGEPEVTR